MELYAGAALSGMGYLLNQQRDVLRAGQNGGVGGEAGRGGAGAFRTRGGPIGRANETPSMDNVYSGGNAWEGARRDEQSRGSAMWAAASAPLESGVVPRPAYASMFSGATAGGAPGSGVASFGRGGLAPQPGPAMSPSGFASPAAGAGMDLGIGMPERARMAGSGVMDPMLGVAGGSGTGPNSRAPRGAPRLAARGPVTSSLTGEAISAEQFLPPNTQPFFRGSVRQNMDYGVNDTLLENYTGRGEMLLSKKEVGCFFEPTSGYGNVCGMPNVSSDIKSRIEAPLRRNNDFPIEQVRVAPGLGAGYTSEGVGGFQQGATLDYIRPKTIDELRPGNRQKLVMEARVQGPAKTATGTQRGTIGDVSKHRPDTYYSQTEDQWLRTRGENDKERQRPVVDLKPTARVDSHVEYKGLLTGVDRPGKGASDDYGKASVVVYENERQTTQTRTVVSNLTSAVKAVVAPLLDVMKHGIKEYTVDAARTFGNMQAQIPTKATVYDPVTGMMRTTLKETMIHDTTISNPRGRDAVPVSRDDTARKTGRETLPVEDTTRNVGSHKYRVIMYNPDAAARKTVRETTTKAANPSGFVGNNVPGSEGAYTVIDVQVLNTQRQFTADNEYTGDAAGGVSDFRLMSQEAQHNAEIDGTREAMNIASGHTPSAGGAFVGLSPENVDMESKKLISDSFAPRVSGNAEAQVPSGVVPIMACDLSRGDPARPNALAGRLDPGVMESLRSNPYSVRINPIGGVAA